ncbi:MAG: ABC transporter ATP-binding protein, partial [Mesorhizobium sp.]|nr:ABC transporter ATP-binding protein [Mesorhizobium sp.]
LDRTVTSTIAPDGDGKWVEYAGGYADMLVQRGSKRFERTSRKPKPQADASAPKAAVAVTQAKPDAKKLSYKQKYALETLPKTMAVATQRMAELEKKLADPALFTRDPAAFQKTIAALDAERAKLTKLEEEWLELEMLREEVEG